MRLVGEALKAIYAGVAAGLATLGTALIAEQTVSAITDAEWVTIAGSVVLAFGAVYGVTNVPRPAANDEGST